MWRDVCGYEGYYQVSDDGKVRTLERYINRNGVMQLRHARPTRCYKNRDGYVKVKLNKDGHSREFFVHRLVAQAFIPNEECKAEVNHINANRADNRKENLEWVSRQENVQHTLNAGRHVSQICDFSGSKNPNYENHALREYYMNNPDMIRKLVRIGKANGMAKQIEIIVKDDTYSFDTIKDGAAFLYGLLDGKYARSTLSSKIGRAIQTGDKIDKYIEVRFC